MDKREKLIVIDEKNNYGADERERAIEKMMR